MSEIVRRDQYSRHNSIKVKARANYTCEKCGSTRMIQAHAPNRDHTDWRNGIALCAECHSKEHPNVPRKLFFTKNHQPYWHNVSANDVAKRLGCHTRTVIRHAKRLGIPSQANITEDSIDQLRQVIRCYSREKATGVPSVRIGQLARLVCIRCGHSWAPRVVITRQCPKCKSPYWDVERRYNKDK